MVLSTSTRSRCVTEAVSCSTDSRSSFRRSLSMNGASSCESNGRRRGGRSNASRGSMSTSEEELQRHACSCAP
eukprot:scaffold40518_cov107-Phaeocystis_antarctica.AAC.4